MIGTLDIRGNESIRRVYSADAESPTAVTPSGGGHEPKVALWGGLGEKNSNSGTQWHEQDRAYGTEGLATSVTAERSFHPSYKEENRMLRIRKLTEGECYRLMGFEDRDAEACRKAGQSAANIYHQAGDSIVTTVLMGIFGELMGIDWEPIAEGYCDKLHEETKKIKKIN